MQCLADIIFLSSKAKCNMSLSRKAIKAFTCPVRYTSAIYENADGTFAFHMKLSLLFFRRALLRLAQLFNHLFSPSSPSNFITKLQRIFWSLGCWLLPSHSRRCLAYFSFLLKCFICLSLLHNWPRRKREGKIKSKRKILIELIFR